MARFVLNSILLLLTKPGPENIRSVCQTLKVRTIDNSLKAFLIIYCHNFQLAGYDLQKENPTEIEDAINQLKGIAEEQNIQTKRLIQSVVDLFYDNWGRKDGKHRARDITADVLMTCGIFSAVELENQLPSSSSLLPDHLPANYNDSPVFYGPDGQIITEEESMFLNANMPANYPINIDDIIE